MNERIRELAEQCREEYPDTEWPDAVRYRFNEEKFAELVIQECMRVVVEGGEMKQTAHYYRKRIKDHFGVQ